MNTQIDKLTGFPIEMLFGDYVKRLNRSGVCRVFVCANMPGPVYVVGSNTCATVFQHVYEGYCPTELKPGVNGDWLFKAVYNHQHDTLKGDSLNIEWTIEEWEAQEWQIEEYLEAKA